MEHETQFGGNIPGSPDNKNKQYRLREDKDYQTRIIDCIVKDAKRVVTPGIEPGTFSARQIDVNEKS